MNAQTMVPWDNFMALKVTVETLIKCTKYRHLKLILPVSVLCYVFFFILVCKYIS